MITSSRNRKICDKYKMNMSEVKYILDKYHLDHNFKIDNRKLCKTCGAKNNQSTCHECKISFNLFYMFLIFLTFFFINCLNKRLYI